MTTTAELVEQYNAAAAQLGRPTVKKFSDRATAERRTAAILAEVTERVTVRTAPLRRDKPSREVQVVRGSRVNRHFNNDGSITVYGSGVKLFRTASDEDIDTGVVGEDYDAEAEADAFIRRWFGGRPIVLGRDTRGHRWKKRAKKAEETPATAD